MLLSCEDFPHLQYMDTLFSIRMRSCDHKSLFNMLLKPWPWIMCSSKALAHYGVMLCVLKSNRDGPNASSHSVTKCNSRRHGFNWQGITLPPHMIAITLVYWAQNCARWRPLENWLCRPAGRLQSERKWQLTAVHFREQRCSCPKVAVMLWAYNCNVSCQ